MIQFQYTAVNNVGKKLNGVIGANSEEEARKQLNALGISVLELKVGDKKEALAQTESANTQNVTLQKFEFEAFDKNGKRIIGTIPAQNRIKAYLRLKEEYRFEVSYIVPFGSTEIEKEIAKQEDLSLLSGPNKAQTSENEIDDNRNKEFETNRKFLLQNVDAILARIQKLLKDFEAEIRPEVKKEIQGMIDKLLRIKSSTNLEYIEHISEDLLKKIQNRELFLHKEKMEAQRKQLSLQTRQMMEDLHKHPGEKHGIIDDLGNIQKKLSGMPYPILRGMAQIMQNWLPDAQEIALKKQIRRLKKQVWTYLKIWATAPTEMRDEAYEGVQKVRDEKNRLITELKQYKRTKNLTKLEATKSTHKENNEKASRKEPFILEEGKHFLGFLLTFYLAAYFISHYAISKTGPLGELMPQELNLLNSNILRGILISVFLWYAFLEIRIRYMRYDKYANLIIIPMGLIINILAILNF